jgi:hypothetical protein
MPAWKETIAPDETSRFDRYAAELRALQSASAQGRPNRRALHVKPHVGAAGELVVPELPANLRVGPFAQPATWPCYVRFSNGSPQRQHDGVADVRGVALKLVGVPGKKLIAGMEDKRTQDFLFIQSQAIPFSGPDDFMTLVRTAAKGKALLVPRLVGAFGLGRALSLVLKLATMPKVASMATSPFFTAVPLRFGDSAAKLSLLPEAKGPRRGPDGRDGLRADLIDRLKEAALTYRLRAQLFVDEAVTPIEDASVVWPEDRSPWLDLGVLHVRQQDVLSPRGAQVEALVESLSFDPWHAVEELRPLGAVMRARAAAYRESTIERKAAAEPEQIL